MPWPAQALRVPVTNGDTTALAGHLDATSTWAPCSAATGDIDRSTELLATMDEVGIGTMVDLDGGQGDALSRAMDRYQAPHPDRRRPVRGAGLRGLGVRKPAFGELEAAATA